MTRTPARSAVHNQARTNVRWDHLPVGAPAKVAPVVRVHR